MIDADEKGKRPRTRAPVSCLNCKKRKVRCDKARPCSGCVKNNVGHLCVYVDPKWADTSKVVAESAQAPHMADFSVIRAEMQRKIDAQAGEIRCLRAQLAQKANNPGFGANVATAMGQNVHVNSDPGPQQHSKEGVGISQSASVNERPSTSSPLSKEKFEKRIPVTVLSKLSGRTSETKPTVLHDMLYTMKGLRKTESASKQTHAPVTSLYSWLNIIKLDPQLTALWFRITNMQKSYHIYKTSLLKSRQEPGAARLSRSESTESNGCGHHKCPVVACEFNLMLEENETSSPDINIKSEKDESLPFSKMTRLRNEVAFGDLYAMLELIQGLWGSVLAAAPNTQKMTFSQLMFLINTYSDPELDEYQEPEKRLLLSFFRSEILALFSQSGPEAKLDVVPFSPNMSHTEVINSLKVKTVYMAMLAVMVDDALHLFLYQKSPQSLDAQFRSLFPSENTNLSDSPEGSLLWPQLMEMLFVLFKLDTPPTQEIKNQMAPLCLLVTALNRLSLMHDESTPSIDLRECFTKLLTILFEMLSEHDAVLQLWRDPSQIKLEGAGNLSYQRENLGLLICSLWESVLRLANNAVFGLLPNLKHGTHIDQLLDLFLVLVPGVESACTHVAYLDKFGSTSQKVFSRKLSLAIQTQYLITRASVMLRNGICGPWADGTAIVQFSSIVDEMAEWRLANVSKLSATANLEASVTLHYLELFFTTIIFLQSEENCDYAAISVLIPALFNKISALNSGSQMLLKDISVSNEKYARAIVAENFARASHLVSGLLIRFKPNSEPEGSSNENLVYVTKFAGQSQAPILVSACKKEDVMQSADRTVEVLEKQGDPTVLSKTKIWRFYQTFIRNSQKLNASSCAKLHAEALGAGRLLDKCPIMSSSGYETSATRMEVSRCPVFQSGKDSNLRAGGCPVTGTQPLIAPKGVKPESPSLEIKGLDNSGAPAGRCPFGHDSSEPIAGSDDGSRKRKHSAMFSETADHGNSRTSFLGRLTKYTPPLCAPPLTPAPAAIPPSKPPAEFEPFPEMDWDSLPNFNFDLMEDEALMGQLNGADFNAPIIGGGLFQ
ncbi:hypothetical protein OXX80_007335 [Metschnikowia pulcherrima]